MKNTVSARIALRDATAGHHQRVDAIYSVAVLNSRASYARFLLAQAAAHLPTEEALDSGGIAAIVPDWPARRRDALLKADLAALGHEIPTTTGFTLTGPAALLGALYVLEGSRLGGTLLRRSVPADFPAAFLGGVDSSAWRSLLDLLDTRLLGYGDVQEAIAAASMVFALFEATGKQYLAAT